MHPLTCGALAVSTSIPLSTSVGCGTARLRSPEYARSRDGEAVERDGESANEAEVEVEADARWAPAGVGY